jgi:hypothetical protein
MPRHGDTVMRNVVLTGDAVEMMKGIADNSVDSVDFDL